MGTKVFLAGATGAIGKRLIPLLLAECHAVFTTTRSAERAGGLSSAGVEPIVVDVFDAQAFLRATCRSSGHRARRTGHLQRRRTLCDRLDGEGSA
jgi:nucleoside-diphosphate-sugar epimerase